MSEGNSVPTALFAGHDITLNTVLIGMFHLALKYGKGSKQFVTSLLKYTLLCLPKENNLPKSYSQFLKVFCLEPLYQTL
jgi:hypothetical protein